MRWHTRSPTSRGVAAVKFGWWREEIQRACEGVPRHPVTRVLAPVIVRHHFERDLLLTMINAAESTVGYVRFETAEALRRYCHGSGGVPHVLAARVFGDTSGDTRDYAEKLGTALRLTELLVGLGRDVRSDRLYLPAPDLRHFGVEEADVLNGKETPALAALLAQQVQHINTQFDEAIACLPAGERAHQTPGLVLAALARAQLAEIAADGYHVLQHRVTLTPLRKLWIAWRTRAAEQRRARRAA